MNWGYKIALAYVVFALGLMSMVFMATQQEFHLVTENYYQKELGHDSLMAAKWNSQQLADPVDISYDAQGKGVRIAFPKEKAPHIQGELHFYHTVSAHKDRRFPLDTLQQDLVFIPRENLESGKWKLLLSWQSGGKVYYDEKTLILP